jgi:hypothetical protein
MDVLHVLVYGSTNAGVCDFYRLGMYAERLAAAYHRAAEHAGLGTRP